MTDAGNGNAPEQLFPNLSLVLFPCTITCQLIRVAVLRPSIFLGRLRDALSDVDPWLRQLVCGGKIWRETAIGRTTLLSVGINSNIFHGALTGRRTSFPFLGQQRSPGRSLARHFCLSIIPKSYAVAFVKRMPSVFYACAKMWACGYIFAVTSLWKLMSPSLHLWSVVLRDRESHILTINKKRNKGRSLFSVI